MRSFEEYLQTATNCPKCGSVNTTSGDEIFMSSGEMEQTFNCMICNHYWVEKWKLVGIHHMEMQDGRLLKVPS